MVWCNIFFFVVTVLYVWSRKNKTQLCHFVLLSNNKNAEGGSIPDISCRNHKVGAFLLYTNSIYSWQPSFHKSIIQHLLSQSDLHREPEGKICNATAVIHESLQLSWIWWWIFLSTHRHHQFVHLSRQLPIFVRGKTYIINTFGGVKYKFWPRRTRVQKHFQWNEIFYLKSSIFWMRRINQLKMSSLKGKVNDLWVTPLLLTSETKQQHAEIVTFAVHYSQGWWCFLRVAKQGSSLADWPVPQTELQIF